MRQGTAADMEEITLGEVKILTSLTHRHIIGYHGRFVQNSCLNILMDYADGWLAVAVVHRTDVVICRWVTGASGTGGKGAGSSVGRKGAALTDCLCERQLCAGSDGLDLSTGAGAAVSAYTTTLRAASRYKAGKCVSGGSDVREAR